MKFALGVLTAILPTAIAFAGSSPTACTGKIVNVGTGDVVAVSSLRDNGSGQFYGTATFGATFSFSASMSGPDLFFKVVNTSVSYLASSLSKNTTAGELSILATGKNVNDIWLKIECQ